MSRTRLTPDRWKEYANDWLSFVEGETYALLEDQYIKPKLFPEQRRLLRRMARPGWTRCYTSWPRKWSKTWTVAVGHCLPRCLFRKNQLLLFCSPSKKLGEELGSKMIVESLKRNQELVDSAGAVWHKDQITFELTGSRIVLVPRGASLGVGLNPNLIFWDEIGQLVDEPAWRWYREISTPSMTRETRIVGVGYRGFRGRSRIQEQWEADARRAVKEKDRTFIVSVKSGKEPRGAPPWITPDKMAAVKKTVDASTYRRVYLNKWSRPGDDDRFMFSDRLVQGITDPDLRSADVRPADAQEVVVTVDVSFRHDTTVLAVWALPANNVPTLLFMDAQMPQKGKDIDLEDVKLRAEGLYRRYAADAMICDMYQMVSACQRWREQGIRVIEWDGSRRVHATAILRNALYERRVRTYPQAGWCEVRGKGWDLQRELKHLVARSNAGGQSYDHLGQGSSPSRGYDDRVTCLCMALLHWSDAGREFSQLSAEEARQWIDEQPKLNTAAAPGELPLLLSQPKHGRFFAGRSPFADFLPVAGAELLVDSAWIESRYPNWSWSDE